MGSSSTSSGSVPVLRCTVFFNGTNYRDWVPRICLHMHSLRLWDFLTGVLPCPPHHSAPAEPVIPEKSAAIEKEKLLPDYKDRLASYESQFHTYRTWLDEDAHASSVLTASIEDHFAANIVEFERGLIRRGLFLVVDMSLQDSLLFLPLFISSSFFTRVMKLLMLASCGFLLSRLNVLQLLVLLLPYQRHLLWLLL
jgi:hypothetical protein